MKIISKKYWQEMKKIFGQISIILEVVS